MTSEARRKRDRLRKQVWRAKQPKTKKRKKRRIKVQSRAQVKARSRTEWATAGGFWWILERDRKGLKAGQDVPVLAPSGTGYENKGVNRPIPENPLESGTEAVSS